MKLVCLQENLNRGLNIVGRAVETKSNPQLLITKNILLATDADRLKLTATNLEMTISHWIDAKVELGGAITVPARLLTGFVESLPNDKIDIQSTATTMNLNCASSKARIQGLDAKDFPPVSMVNDDLVTTEIDMPSFRQGINWVAIAAATEGSRPVLTGINTQFEGNVLTLVAADGFRLAEYKLKLDCPVDKKITVIIPARALTELGRIVVGNDDPVKVTVGNNKVQFQLKDTELISQTLQGLFPAYHGLIPRSFGANVKTNASELLRAVKLAMAFTEDNIVKLITTQNKITVIANSSELGESTNEVPVITEGNDTQVALNGKYLAEVLNALKNDQVEIGMNLSSNPIVISLNDYIHVIMPIMTNW